MTFSGRASRSEYWWFLPIGILLPIVVLILLTNFWPDLPIWQVAIISFLFLFPQMSVTARRLHDTCQPSSDIDVPTYALIGLIFCIVAYLEISVWLDSLMMIDDPPNALGLILLMGSVFIVGFVASLVFLLVGMATGIPLFSQMILPSHQKTNRYGPNPHEVTP